jgi:beta-xylosidase
MSLSHPAQIDIPKRRMSDSKVRFATIVLSICLVAIALARIKGGLAPGRKDRIASTVQINSVRAGKPTQGEWGDQGDGTYANPVMPGDFSDLDAIRVGEHFYAISSTFQYSPGLAVLHSRDLVNWEMIGHVVPRLTRISPDLNWDKMKRDGRGIWAGAIRFHAGKYWVYFGTPDEGLFMSTAKDPAGPWTPVKQVYSEPGWDDPCPFWDDDGQAYLVTTHFRVEASNGKDYNIHLFKMTSDGEALLPGSDRIIHQSPGSEANKLYKRNGLYYHYYSEVTPEGRVIMLGRAPSLAGPWKTKQLFHVHPLVDKEPNQGGLIELSRGAWYFVTHQGTGDWEGRAGVLLPVTWIQGWPIIGRVGPDGIGNMVWRGPKPISGFPLTSLAASDDFSEQVLRPEWEWRYQPRSTKWSLAERPGFLRLHGFHPQRGGDFRTVGNVLTQRSMRTKQCQVTVEFDIAGLVAGQEAGIAHFAKTFCTFGVVQTGTIRALVYNNNGHKMPGPSVSQNTLWLRSTWDFSGQNQFAYSLDGIAFSAFGNPYQLSWGSYRGDRIGLFTYNNAQDGGFLDVAAFSYKVAR